VAGGGSEIEEINLNSRQESVLYWIFDCDQKNERDQKNKYLQGRKDNTPASEWRWLIYDRRMAQRHAEHELKRALRHARLVDPGLGSTFKALHERGLILVEHADWDCFGNRDVRIQITRKGRTLIRKLFPDYKPSE